MSERPSYLVDTRSVLCTQFQGDTAKAVQPMENVHYGQSVILNTKTRQLFVKTVNATSQVKFANINLERFERVSIFLDFGDASHF